MTLFQATDLQVKALEVVEWLQDVRLEVGEPIVAQLERFELVEIDEGLLVDGLQVALDQFE